MNFLSVAVDNVLSKPQHFKGITLKTESYSKHLSAKVMVKLQWNFSLPWLFNAEDKHLHKSKIFF